MHSPNVPALLEELHQQRIANRETGLDPDLRDRVVVDVASTLDYIEHRAPAGIKEAHEKHVSLAQVNAGVQKYANELANGRVFPEKSPYLRQLLSTNPLPEKAAAPASSPAAKPAPRARMSHLLRDDENMRIFRQEVERIALTDSEPGQKAAKWIQNMLANEKIGEAGVIKLFEDMKVLADIDEKTRPSSINGSSGGVKAFVKTLSSAQKKELHAVTTNDDRNIVRRTLRPQEGPDISRRMFVFGGLATGLGIQAVRKYNQSVDKIDKASGAPPSKKEMPEGDLDFFDRPDPRTVVQSEASKSLVAAAKVDQQWAAGYAVGGGVVAIPAIISAAKLALGVDKTRFRGEVSSLMARMDHVVGAVKNEIRAQDHGVA